MTHNQVIINDLIRKLRDKQTGPCAFLKFLAFFLFLKKKLIFVLWISGAKHQVFLGTEKPSKLTYQKVHANLSRVLGSICYSTWNSWMKLVTSLPLIVLIFLSGLIRGYDNVKLFWIFAWLTLKSPDKGWLIMHCRDQLHHKIFVPSVRTHLGLWVSYWDLFGS